MGAVRKFEKFSTEGLVSLRRAHRRSPSRGGKGLARDWGGREGASNLLLVETMDFSGQNNNPKVFDTSANRRSELSLDEEDDSVVDELDSLEVRRAPSSLGCRSYRGGGCCPGRGPSSHLSKVARGQPGKGPTQSISMHRLPRGEEGGTAHRMSV